MRIYANKDFFEEILAEISEFPVLNNVFRYHSRVFLDMTEDEMEKEEADKGFIFELINSRGGKGVDAFQEPFEKLKADETTILEDIRSIYLLNEEDNKVNELSDHYGVMVFNRNTLDESLLRLVYEIDLDQEQVWTAESYLGWEHVFNRKLPPSNSLVISDDFLYKNESGKRGMANIKNLLKAALPDNLVVDFNILILTSEHIDHMDRQKCELLVGNLKSYLGTLNKPYDIKLEFVFSKAIHKRIMISNYYYLVAEKGFAVFKTIEPQISHEDTDLELKGLFAISNINEGDSGLNKVNTNLKRIKRVCNSTSEFLKNQKDIINFRIFGDCNKDKSIKNRLLNEFDKY